MASGSWRVKRPTFRPRRQPSHLRGRAPPATPAGSASRGSLSRRYDTVNKSAATAAHARRSSAGERSLSASASLRSKKRTTADRWTLVRPSRVDRRRPIFSSASSAPMGASTKPRSRRAILRSPCAIGSHSPSTKHTTAVVPSTPTMTGCGNTSVSVGLGAAVAVVSEPVQGKLEATREELVAEGGANARGPQRAEHALPIETVALEHEEILHRDQVALVTPHLADLRDLSRAVLHPLHIDDQVDRGHDLLSYRAKWQIGTRHQHHRLDPSQGVARSVRVDRRERSIVARVHRLEHVERLGTAALADDDAIRTHPERVAKQIADGDLAVALHIGGACLERDDVHLLQAQLRGVFDRHDALSRGDVRRKRIQEGRLARATSAGDDHIQPTAYTGSKELKRLGCDRRMPQELVW